ncbi:MAG: hypothetical protein ACYS9X_24625 [Planctomycetota bacterium]|jgi:hypothetical protein
MREDRDTGLIDPVLTLNGVRARVTGTTPYNSYLVYRGGAGAKVYDPNWNFVKDLPVSGPGFEAVQGDNTFSVTSAKSPDAWLSSRIKVEDTANRITIRKPTAAQ